ncbi:MAG: NrfD/PsrC family molybdoenzyme membrane anchor subunit [Thermoleophilia bacterium]
MATGDGCALLGVSAESLRSVRRQWGRPIALYLFLAGMGAGAFLVGVSVRSLGLAADPVVRSVGGIELDLAGLALLWGPLVVALGAPFLIVDLGRKTRFFRAGFNARVSWMARGFYVLSAFIAVGGMACVIAVLAPAWPAAHSGPWRGLVVAAALLALGTAAYTGVLLRSLRFVPVWRSYLLPVLFVVSALSTGSMGVILASVGVGSLGAAAGSLEEGAHTLARVEQGLILLEGVVLAVYLLRVGRGRSGGGEAVRMLVRGRLRLLFWGGIVGMGLVFPSVLELLYRRSPGSPFLLWTAGALLLAGGFLLRMGLLAAATKEELPLQKLLEAKAHSRTLRVDL